MRWAGKMCIFNGAFALEWVGGLVRRPPQIRFWSSLQSLTDTDLSGSAETRRYGCGADSEEKNEKHLWGESCWFDCLAHWLTGWGWILHGACSRGLVTGEDGSYTPTRIPSRLTVAVYVSPCTALCLSWMVSKLIWQILYPLNTVCINVRALN